MIQINGDPSQILAEVKKMSMIELSDYRQPKDLLYEKLFSNIPSIMNKITIGDPVFRTVQVYRDNLNFGEKRDFSRYSLICH